MGFELLSVITLLKNASGGLNASTVMTFEVFETLLHPSGQIGKVLKI